MYVIDVIQMNLMYIDIDLMMYDDGRNYIYINNEGFRPKGKKKKHQFLMHSCSTHVYAITRQKYTRAEATHPCVCKLTFVVSVDMNDDMNFVVNMLQQYDQYPVLMLFVML